MITKSGSAFSQNCGSRKRFSYRRIVLPASQFLIDESESQSIGIDGFSNHGFISAAFTYCPAIISGRVELEI